MSNKELKTVWKFSLSFWIGGLSLWILKTSIPIEIYCDEIVSDMLNIAGISTTFVCLNLLYNLNSK
jgi:hypothetical protein